MKHDKKGKRSKVMRWMMMMMMISARLVKWEGGKLAPSHFLQLSNTETSAERQGTDQSVGSGSVTTLRNLA
jgi:hypothetical protein